MLHTHIPKLLLRDDSNTISPSTSAHVGGICSHDKSTVGIRLNEPLALAFFEGDIAERSGQR
jgi:hypothetical protein